MAFEQRTYQQTFQSRWGKSCWPQPYVKSKREQQATDESWVKNVFFFSRKTRSINRLFSSKWSALKKKTFIEVILYRLSRVYLGIYIHIHMCMLKHLVKTETRNLKQSGYWYRVEFEGRKGRGNYNCITISKKRWNEKICVKINND